MGSGRKTDHMHSTERAPAGQPKLCWGYSSMHQQTGRDRGLSRDGKVIWLPSAFGEPYKKIVMPIVREENIKRT